MQWTVGNLLHFQAFSSLQVFSALKHCPRLPVRRSHHRYVLYRKLIVVEMAFIIAISVTVSNRAVK
jgi:hypothetical protein